MSSSCRSWERHVVVCGLLMLVAGSAQAGQVDAPELSGWWALPFAGTLLSLAVVPLFGAIFWAHHYGKVIAGWVLALAIPFTIVFGVSALGQALLHALVEEYIPFILLLSALYVVAGGIFIRTDLRAGPAANTGIIAVGGILASIMGTTGASMLLIRPLVRLNRHRPHCAHVVVFFIFIVANIGGALSPLGDPPLFLGFLKGVPFFWPLQHLALQTGFIVVVLLVIFHAWDRHRFAHDAAAVPLAGNTPANGGWSVRGWVNFLLLGVIVALVLASGVWHSEHQFHIGSASVTLPDLVRDTGLLAVCVLSSVLTPAEVRRANAFSWAPMIEVAKIFAGIFITIIPVIALLKAGMNGPFAPVVGAVSNSAGAPLPAMYFWATGALSSVLDNAPTYLVFFNTAGGDAALMTTTWATTLAAMSAGAVFMGANTYIGNAPNLMVKAVAQEQGVAMPGFFGYMVWSLGILVPLFALVTCIWYL